MPMPSSLLPEPRDITSIIRPANVQCVIAALDPAFSVDYCGMAAVVSYTFDREALLVGHVHRMAGAGASSLDLVREFVSFIASIKQKSGAQWASAYTCLDATKDRSVVDRMFELGLGDGRRATGRGAVNFAPLTGILFGGAGTQATMGQPLFANIAGRGRFSAPCWHVPKVDMYTRLRERLALGLLKLAPGESTQQLLRELESLEARITAARRVTIQPGGEEHDDLADALAMAVWLGQQYEAERIRAIRSANAYQRPAPSKAAWT